VHGGVDDGERTTGPCISYTVANVEFRFLIIAVDDAILNIDGATRTLIGEPSIMMPTRALLTPWMVKFLRITCGLGSVAPAN
jgi:hypothetical protein